MYRTKDSYSSTNNSSSNNSFNSTKSSVSAVVNNNVDDSLTIISNNRDASIKLDELSQRSYSISTSDNGVLDDDLEVENPTNNPEVAHVVEHEICDERRSKSSLAKRRRRAGNHNERSDSRRYARSSSSSSSSSSGNTLHSTHSHKSDTHREVHPCSDDRSHLGGSQIPLYSECNCSHYHSNHQKDHSDTPESALIPRPQTSGCQCSYYSATCSTKPSSCSCCSTCHCSDNRCCGCGCDKSIHHKIHPDSECSASSVDFGDDDDVDDEGPKQSLSHNTSSSSTSIASSAPLSVASNLSSISSIHSSSRPQNETHLSNDSKYKHKNHIKTILWQSVSLVAWPAIDINSLIQQTIVKSAAVHDSLRIQESLASVASTTSASSLRNSIGVMSVAGNTQATVTAATVVTSIDPNITSSSTTLTSSTTTVVSLPTSTAATHFNVSMCHHHSPKRGGDTIKNKNNSNEFKRSNNTTTPNELFQCDAIFTQERCSTEIIL